jgi:hypothetical protein
MSNERTPLAQLQSLLGVWVTDAPTWPPGPGVEKAIRLLRDVERDHVESLAVYIGQIKALAAELAQIRREYEFDINVPMAEQREQIERLRSLLLEEYSEKDIERLCGV